LISANFSPALNPYDRFVYMNDGRQCKYLLQ